MPTYTILIVVGGFLIRFALPSSGLTFKDTCFEALVFGVGCAFFVGGIHQ